MRWGWRVEYHLYNAAATDAYPPFSMADEPSYPARLDVRYPERLSRGLVLVKWWLLAIPHYLILALLFGGSSTYTDTEGNVQRGTSWPGLVPIMVLIALLAVLFTGAYPKQLYQLVMGFNRWQVRVLAHVLLMTDQYPPFRLDQGPFEPGGPRWVAPPAPGGWPGQTAQEPLR